MSEMPPEAGGGGLMSKRFFGIPAPVLIIGVALLAYLYFRNKSSAGSSGSAPSTSGTATTGNIGISPGTTTFNIKSQYAQTQKTSHHGNPPPRHRTPNPQPAPHTKVPVKKHVTTKRVVVPNG